MMYESRRRQHFTLIPPARHRVKKYKLAYKYNTQNDDSISTHNGCQKLKFHLLQLVFTHIAFFSPVFQVKTLIVAGIELG